MGLALQAVELVSFPLAAAVVSTAEPDPLNGLILFSLPVALWLALAAAGILVAAWLHAGRLVRRGQQAEEPGPRRLPR